MLAAIRPQGREGVWALPKGKIDAGESPAETAVREVREETGVEGRLVEKLGDVRYVYTASCKGGERIFKVVSFFLLRAGRGRIGAIEEAMRVEVAEARWLPLEEAPRLLPYGGPRRRHGRRRNVRLDVLDADARGDRGRCAGTTAVVPALRLPGPRRHARTPRRGRGRRLQRRRAHCRHAAPRAAGARPPNRLRGPAGDAAALRSRDNRGGPAEPRRPVRAARRLGLLARPRVDRERGAAARRAEGDRDRRGQEGRGRARRSRDRRLEPRRPPARRCARDARRAAGAR